MKILETVIQISSFSVIGVMIRYYLKIAFGPEELDLLSSDSADFTDLASNLIGTFVIGIGGVALKPQILEFHEPIFFGITTGLCGSITTFSSWNNQITHLFISGRFSQAALCIIIGLSLPYSGIQTGIFIGNLCKSNQRNEFLWKNQWKIIIFANFFGVVVCMASFAMIISALIIKSERFDKILWGGAFLGPFGSIVRWKLSKFNILFSQRIPAKEKNETKESDIESAILIKHKSNEFIEAMRKIPWGTLAANVLSSWIFEILIVIEGSILYNSWILKAALIGLLGCLSTISTFMSEIYALSQQEKNYAWLYIITTLLLSLTGSLIISATI